MLNHKQSLAHRHQSDQVSRSRAPYPTRYTKWQSRVRIAYPAEWRSQNCSDFTPLDPAAIAWAARR